MLSHMQDLREGLGVIRNLALYIGALRQSTPHLHVGLGGGL